MLTPSRLAIARKRRGLTLTRLAELTGLSTHSLSVYENGHQAPTEETLLVLADALDTTPALPGRSRRGGDSSERGQLPGAEQDDSPAT